MRGRFPATLAVSEPFHLERFGQLALSQGGRISSFTAANAPSVAGYRDHQIDVAKRKVVLDDGDDRQQSALTNARPLPYPQPGLSITNRFRGGDEITGLTGVLDWSSAGAAGTDAWRLRPVPETETYTFVPANPRPAGPPNVGGSLRIASLNVRNFFSTIDPTASSTSRSCGPDGLHDCRGADSLAERVRKTNKLVAALCRLDADVVGLMEMENDAFSTASVLVAGTNAVPDCGPYSFVNSGPIGGDAIKVGLLYRTTTVTASGPHAILDSTVDPRFLDTRHRPVLAQTFVETATGSKWTVALVHLRSKGSACSGDPDLGDGQGNCNLTRTTAAQAIVDWLATDPTASADPGHLIIGDLNSYTHEEPVRAIEAGPDDAAATSDDYVDVIATLVGQTAYGYVFDGQVGRLDHAHASASMASQLMSAALWHINADEPPSFDYNDTIVDVGEASFEAKPTALPLYSADEFRTSDHDPLVIGLPEPGLGISLAAGLSAAGMSARRRRMTSSGGGRRRMEGGRGL